MNLKIQNLKWFANQSLRKLGLLGLFGLAITLGCSLFYATQLLPKQKELNHLTNQLQEINVNQSRQINDEKIVQAPLSLPKQISSADVEKFYATFPDGANLPSMINLIRENAQKQKLVLTRGDYKLTQTKNTQQTNTLVRYEMVLPVKGSYLQIRTFIADVLFKLPMLGLSDVQINRENTLNPLVDARLTFVFLLHDDVWQKSAIQGGNL
jgi:Tfp pilus assembly protein PilO